MKRNRSKRRPDRRLSQRIKRFVKQRLDTLWFGARMSGRYTLRSAPYVLVALTAMLLPVAAVTGYRYVTRAPSFGVSQVQVTGNARNTAERVLEIGGVSRGPNLLSLDLRQIEERLVADPWIVRAHVDRQLPDRLIVSVHEREPVALLALGALYLVDAKGVIFKRVESGEHFDYPILTGLTREDLDDEVSTDRAELSERMVRGALRLLKAWGHSEFGKDVPISEVRMDPVFGYAVVVSQAAGGAGGAVLMLGRGALKEKLGRLEAVLADARRREKRVAEVRLDDERDPLRVAVRFRSSTPAPAEPGSNGRRGRGQP